MGKENELAKLAHQELKKTKGGSIPSGALPETQDISECGRIACENGEHAQTSASVIKRGVPKSTKPAPPVVAVKMSELLAVPDGQNEEDPTGAAASAKDNLENEADEVKQQEQLERQRREEQIKLDKELKLQEKLKGEEEAKHKKELERLEKIQKKEELKLEKLKKEEEAKAKKQKQLEEKRQKQEQQKIEKQKKEDEAKAKKAEERKEKEAKIKQEKLTKREREQSTKNKGKAEMQAAPEMVEKQIQEEETPKDQVKLTGEDVMTVFVCDGDDLMEKNYAEQDQSENDLKSDLKPTESVIKRGIPKNTKPAPAVVAIKMADLLEDDGPNIETSQDPSQNVTDLKNKKEMEKKMQDEKLKLEKEQQETLKKEEEAKAKKEQETLAKQQKKEELKLEKLKK